MDILKRYIQKTYGPKEQPAPAPAPQQPVATIVVPPQQQQQTAALPTTIAGGMSLQTSTPVKVSSPINVSTPVSQNSTQIVGSSATNAKPKADVNALINLANLAVNTVGAAMSIVGSVPAWLNTFLPDCPPPAPSDTAPIIPGCQIVTSIGQGLDSLLSIR